MGTHSDTDADTSDDQTMRPEREDQAPPADHLSKLAALESERARMQQEIAALRDQSERVQRELARLRAVFDSIPDVLFAQDEQARFVLVNHAFCERLGTSPEDVLGKTAEQALPRDAGQAFHELCLQVLATRQPLRSQDQLTPPGAQEFTLESLVTPCSSQGTGGLGAVLIGRDVTERVRLGEAIEQAKYRAESASRSKTGFLANMSHEIRTPLNSIIGYSQLLSRRAQDPSLPIEMREAIDHINVSGHNLAEIVNNVLELSKIEEGKATISSEPLNLGLLTRRVHDICKLQALDKGVEFDYRYDDTLPKAIHSDRTKLTQILSNLINNAIKFTPLGKRVELRVERREDTLRFIVEDQGIGIPPDKQASIFEPFEQADSSIPGAYGGTGLGLAISKKLCELLGGQIWLDSVLGHGTTFYVELPLVISAVEVEMIIETEDAMPRFPADTRILLVEDNPINQKVMRALFKELGIDVHIADDGRIGVAMALKLEPHCIFMDLHMPNMDGLAATRRLRKLEQFAHVPIIALSADAFTEQREVAFEAGVTDYLTKPLMLDRLLYKLRKYLPH